MRLVRALSFAVLLGALWPQAARAADDVELSATLDRDEIGLDDMVRLEITVTLSSKDTSGDLQLPGFRDFDIVGRAQSEQVSFAFSGGAPTFRRTTVYAISLTPHRAGTLSIEAVRFVYKGHTYVTGAQSVRVLPAGQTPAPKRSRGGTSPRQQLQQEPSEPDPMGDPFEGSRGNPRDLTLRSVVDVERPFVGQQVTWSLWLLARVNVSGIDKLQLPRMDGFWTEEIEAPQQLVGEARVIDGVPMQAFLLRRRALFPLKSGPVAIDPAEVEVLTGMGMLFSRSNVNRKTDVLTLDVQPLPPGAPPGFDHGNVGQWAFNATIEPVGVNAGQPVTLRLQASGRGNLRDLQLPHLPLVQGLRAYDATSTDKTSIEQGKVGGTRTVEQLLVPERTGEIEIPALTLETFDPLARTYKTLRTQPLHVTVGAAQGNVSGGTPGAQNLLAAGGLRPIRLHLTRASAAPPPWTKPWFWPALILGPLLAGVLALAQRLMRLVSIDPTQKKFKLAASAARRRLRGAEALLEKQRSGADASGEFYAEVARALSGYLADKQGVAASGLTRDELAQALMAKGHEKPTVDKLVSVLDECDRARFAPGARSAAAQEAVLQRADQVLLLLDKARKEAA
ncbi:MAG: protein BatD [Deltaproteobacteria bacterium]|nr:protein BatD [Deltaproteobacteria bacterium]